jgi:ribosomal protein S18 acetylase RimI-like enzyme
VACWGAIFLQDDAMSIVIRTATSTDIQTIVQFNQQLAEESEGKKLDPEIILRGVHRALSSPQLCRYYVAEDQGKVIGQTMVTFEITDWRDGIAYWIQSVYVAKGHRQRGVFQRLYDHIQDEARKDGHVRLIRLYVEVENHAAIAVYERMGMVKARYHFFEATVS